MSTASFEEVLLRSVEQSLQKVFGPVTARAVRFYADSRIVMNNPRAYEEVLRKVFKEGADIIIKEIEQKICGLAGLENREAWSSLEECVTYARSNFPQTKSD